MTDVIEAIADSIISHVRNEDLSTIELVLKAADDRTWREVLRHEFNIFQLMETILDSDVLAPRLVMFDITTISTFHYAALRGVDGILERFLARSNLPVDVALTTGTTALHLACFAGAVDTVEMLIDKYRAGINRKDIYGWTPLHYSTLGGQLDVIRLLVTRGADILARDKDGTTAAFRAEAFGRDDIVTFLLDSSADDEQLLIDDHSEKEDQSTSLYASIPCKNPVTKTVHSKPIEPDYKSNLPNKCDPCSDTENPYLIDSENPYLLESNTGSVSIKDSVHSSSFLGLRSEPTYSSVLLQNKYDHVPTVDRNSEPIYSRYLITENSLGNKKPGAPTSISNPTHRSTRSKLRTELKDIIGSSSDCSVNAKSHGLDDIYISKKEQKSVKELDDCDIEYNTLTSIMREEFLKFRASKLQNQMRKPMQTAVINVHTDDYEEIAMYAQLGTPDVTISNSPKHQNRKETCLENINKSPNKLEATESVSDSVAPPLPPRNAVAKTRRKTDSRNEYDERAKMILILSKFEHDSAVMEACFQTLASRLHSPDDWKKLAYSLPLRDSSSLVEKKIKVIEERHPADVHRQTVELLRQWRSYQGEKATVGGITLAMMNCGLGEHVAAVEQGSEEFSA